MAVPKICHITTVDLSVRFLLLNRLRYLREKGMQVHAACSDGEWLRHDLKGLFMDVVSRKNVERLCLSMVGKPVLIIG